MLDSNYLPCFDSLCSQLALVNSPVHSFLSTMRHEFSGLQQRERSLIAAIGFGLSILFYLVSISVFLRYTRKKTKSAKSTLNSSSFVNRHQQIHRALSSFIVPTPQGRSRFPADFYLASTQISSSNVNAIKLDLAIFLARLLSGRLELREDSLGSLESLVKGSLCVDEYQTTLSVGKKMWADVASWILLGSYGSSGGAMANKNSTQGVLDLDFVPYGSLESTIKSLVLSLPFGSRAVVEFTTLSPHIKWLSKDFALCAVPFLYSRQDSQMEAPTPTPMLLSLNQVIAILSLRCYSPSLGIISCTNSSADFSTNLQRLARELAPCHVEQKALHLWQAALLNAGLIHRWVVVVSK
ncbi:hypothetical protein GYMLUDRAFT_40817 [Collybiopsis luxurians FD-317 M1]|uniref:Uncharacterized protein n=1 Tax=Collybiopsis luxurians FD-317 M1 TaxID=944289 RepID=A0A0D0CVL6_9AGAR|nr:hypothetical protein GYMLUDRAFT_40817 [Collybiopsis luxurians FD-317 M1]